VRFDSFSLLKSSMKEAASILNDGGVACLLFKPSYYVCSNIGHKNIVRFGMATKFGRDALVGKCARRLNDADLTYFDLGTSSPMEIAMLIAEELETARDETFLNACVRIASTGSHPNIDREDFLPHIERPDQRMVTVFGSHNGIHGEFPTAWIKTEKMALIPTLSAGISDFIDDWQLSGDPEEAVAKADWALGHLVGLYPAVTVL